MKTKELINTRRFLTLDKILFATLFLSLLSVVVFLLLKTFQQPEVSLDNNLTQTQREFLTIDNPSQIVSNSGIYNLPSDWQVISIYKNPQDFPLQCASLSGVKSTECVVYDITNGTNTFYASLKEPLLNGIIPLNSELTTKSIKFLGENRDVFMQALALEVRTDESEGGKSELSTESFIRQAYLCSSGEVCFSTGDLGLDIEDSSKSLTAFISFLEGIKLQK